MGSSDDGLCFLMSQSWWVGFNYTILNLFNPAHSYPGKLSSNLFYAYGNIDINPGRVVHLMALAQFLF